MSISGQFARPRKLQTLAQDANSKEIAKTKLGRLLSHNKTFKYADTQVGHSVIFSTQIERPSGAAQQLRRIWIRRESL